MFGTMHWQEDNWQRNRSVFGNIKETGGHFVMAHQGFKAPIMIIKKCVPALEVQ
jgi:hypothetical protein